MGIKHLGAAMVALSLLGCGSGNPSSDDAATATDGATMSGADGATSTDSDGSTATTGDGGASGGQSCAVLQVRQRRCTRGGDATLVDLHSCDAGDACTAPAAYNETLDDIMCVDSYRFERHLFPATCAQVEDYLAGRLECLVPRHCSGSEEHVGDWQCDLTVGCVCPSGGTCPTPLPPGSDGGTATGSDGGTATTSDGGTSTTSDGGTSSVDAFVMPVDAFVMPVDVGVDGGSTPPPPPPR